MFWPTRRRDARDFTWSAHDRALVEPKVSMSVITGSLPSADECRRAASGLVTRSLSELSHEEVVGLLDASLEIELRELARTNESAVFRDLPGLAWSIGAVPGATVYRTNLDAAEADE